MTLIWRTCYFSAPWLVYGTTVTTEPAFAHPHQEGTNVFGMQTPAVKVSRAGTGFRSSCSPFISKGHIWHGNVLRRCLCTAMPLHQCSPFCVEDRREILIEHVITAWREMS